MLDFMVCFYGKIGKNEMEVLKMKKIEHFIQSHVNVLASLAMVFSVLAANSRCVCIYHQPSIPEGLQKLKRS